VTDHRIKHTSHALEAILQGQLDEFTEALRVADRGARLAETG
jgi:protein subunit release factor A